MVLEIAEFDIAPGAEQAFRDAYAEARAIVAAADGVGAIRMTQGIETPTRFVLLIEWPSVEAHETFRAGESFTRWRALISPHFAAPPHVEHVADV